MTYYMTYYMKNLLRLSASILAVSAAAYIIVLTMVTVAITGLI